MNIYRRPQSGVAAGDAMPFTSAGEYHLFHLSSPLETTNYPDRVRTTWQHLRSRNLLDWEELPPALLPGNKNDPDADGAWTGSLIEADGVYHLFYTGHQLGSSTPQTICHATSRDLIEFTKDPANPILTPDTAAYESIDWRDPFLRWNEQEQIYWMLIAARLNEGPKWRRGCIALATSQSLTRWKLETEPFYAPMTTYCPECPELFRLGDYWYLVFSRFSENAATIYRIADNPRGPWRVPQREALDGRRWYASKSAPKDDRTRVFFGWIHDRSNGLDSGTWLWGGDFAAPREAVADASGELEIRLPANIASAYSQCLQLDIPGAHRRVTPHSYGQNLTLSAVGSFNYVVFPVTAVDYLLSCRFVAESQPASFGIIFHADSELSALAVVFDRARSSVALVRWPQPLDTFWADLVGRGHETREVDGPRLVEHPPEVGHFRGSQEDDRKDAGGLRYACC